MASAAGLGVVSSCLRCGIKNLSVNMLTKAEQANVNTRLGELLAAQCSELAIGSARNQRSAQRTFLIFAERNLKANYWPMFIGVEGQDLAVPPQWTMLQFLLEKASARSSMRTGSWENLVTALQQWFAIRGHPGPRDWPELAMARKGLKRKMGKLGKAVVTPKKPIRLVMIMAAVELWDERRAKRARRYGRGSVHVYICWRALYWFIYGFFGIARASDAACQQLKNIRYLTNGRRRIGVRLDLPCTKTDQFGRSQTQYLAEFSGAGFPLLQWIERIKTGFNDCGLGQDDYAMQAVGYHRGGAMALKGPMGNAAATLKKVLVETMAELLVTPLYRGTAWIKELRSWTTSASIGCGSLRRGGESHARNSGVSKRAVMKHGRWRSDVVTAYDEMDPAALMAEVSAKM
jgi:hypothetical protein